MGNSTLSVGRTARRAMRAVMIATLVCGAIAVPLSQPAEAASSSVRFNYVQFDGPGKDKGSNYSLNLEWVSIKNFGKKSVNLQGWTVRDKANHVYTFGSLSLKPGATVTLYTGSGKNSSSKRYWGSSWYVWNNTGDTAYLKNSTGATVHKCTAKGAKKKCSK